MTRRTGFPIVFAFVVGVISGYMLGNKLPIAPKPVPLAQKPSQCRNGGEYAKILEQTFGKGIDSGDSKNIPFQRTSIEMNWLLPKGYPEASGTYESRGFAFATVRGKSQSQLKFILSQVGQNFLKDNQDFVVNQLNTYTYPEGQISFGYERGEAKVLLSANPREGAYEIVLSCYSPR